MENSDHSDDDRTSALQTSVIDIPASLERSSTNGFLDETLNLLSVSTSAFEVEGATSLTR